VRVAVTVEVVYGVQQLMVIHGVLSQMALLCPPQLHLRAVTLRSQKTKESIVGQEVAHQRLVVLMLVVSGARAVPLTLHGVSSTRPICQKE